MNKNTVLYPEVTRSDVEKAIAGLGLALHQAWEKDEAGGGYEQVWTNAEQSVAVNYIESSLLNLSYLVVRGQSAGSLLHKLEEKLHAFSAEEILDSAYEGRTHNEQVRCLSRLAAMFPHYEERAFEVFQALATQNESQLLQEAAINAMGYRGWPQSVSLLEQIAASDPSERVRERARHTLRHITADAG